MGDGMASEASWQTSSASQSSEALSADQPMDQRTVASLLRLLVERVEESERHYSEALEDLHVRLDRLSQTTEAAREIGYYGDAQTFDRLHAQVSDLARRFEQNTETPLDDFERLGKALSGGMGFSQLRAGDSLPESFGQADVPGPFAPAAVPSASREPAPPAGGMPDFSFVGPESSYHPVESKGLGNEESDLDNRLVEMVHRLEQSIGTVMPTAAIEALNTKLDEIGPQLSKTLERAPTRESLERVERKISDMAQQLERAEAQLGKMSGIEGHLLKLSERLDEKPSTQVQFEPTRIEEIASKAATEAARRVAGEAQQSMAACLDAMQRDLIAISDKSRESSDRLASTLQAVQESLRQVVQQLERGAQAPQPKPRAPFAERIRAAAPAQPQPAIARTGRFAEARIEKTAAPRSQTGTAPSPKDRQQRNQLGAGIPDFKEPVPPFGRAKRNPLNYQAVDLDASGPRAPGPTGGLNADMEAPGDLVTAARKAAQAAALRAEERSARGRHISDALLGSAPMSAEAPLRRKRSALIFAAAVLLLLSAALLYGRLKTKPEGQVTAPATEQTTPPPADSSQGNPARDTDESAPRNAPEKSGSWTPLPDSNEAPAAS
jgi:localization factor PodJL